MSTGDYVTREELRAELDRFADSLAARFTERISRLEQVALIQVVAIDGLTVKVEQALGALTDHINTPGKHN